MLTVKAIRDSRAVDAVLCHPAIAPKLRHDGREPGFIKHRLVSYYGAFVDDRLVGVFTAVAFTRWEVEVHVAIIPDAIRHAHELCRLFLAEVFAKRDVMRVTAYVLATLTSAANLCRRLGFVDEGRRRDACRVDGMATDVIVLGMTRRDWPHQGLRQ